MRELTREEQLAAMEQEEEALEERAYDKRTRNAQLANAAALPSPEQEMNPYRDDPSSYRGSRRSYYSTYVHIW